MIRMVSELHRFGYQRLRIFPYEYPLAWRLCIGPRGVFSRHNGAFVPGYDDLPTYSSASENEYFGWADAKTADARGLAERFIDRFPRVAEAGRGRDWEYAGWLAELVGELERGGRLPVVVADAIETKPYSLPCLPWIDYARGHAVEMAFPLPPGGDLDDPLEDHLGGHGPHGLMAAFANAARPNYLGDPTVVRGLVDAFVDLSVRSARDETLADELAASAATLGRIFAGEVEGYTAIGPWNGPGQLGEAIERCFGTDAAPMDRSGFARFIAAGLLAVRDAVRAVAADPRHVAGIAGYATAVLLGYPVQETLGEVVSA